MRRFLVGSMALCGALAPNVEAQPAPRLPGPPHDPKATERRMDDIRRRLETNPPVTGEQRELADFVRAYLDQASRGLAAGEKFPAECITDAADACRRSMDHLQHVAGAAQTRQPPSEGHIRQVYFRLRLSDFFLQQIRAPKPERLLELARQLYYRAVKTKEEGDANRAEEYTKAADDLTHALESLAQADVGNPPNVP